MKKLLLLFVTMLTVTLTNAQTVGATFTVNDINYEVTTVDPSGDEVQITGNTTTQTTVTIPATVNDGTNNFDVTFIKKEAFSAHATMEALVVLGDTEIDQQVFNACSKLVSADLSNTTSGVGLNAFVNCPLLETVDLSKATSIGKFSFKLCPKLTTIDLSSLVTVGIQAFLSATSLTSLDLPAVKTIEGLAFWKCTSLATVNIPVVETILAGAFNTTALTTITLPSTLTSLPGSNTFRNIPALGEVIVQFSTPFVLDTDATGDMFSSQVGQVPTPSLIVPVGTSAAFAAESGWDVFTITETTTLSTNSVEAALGWNVYTSQDSVSITNDEAENAEVTIYDITGKALLNTNINGGESEVNTSGLANGVYVLKVNTEKGIFTKKFIKQ